MDVLAVSQPPFILLFNCFFFAFFVLGIVMEISDLLIHILLTTRLMSNEM